MLLLLSILACGDKTTDTAEVQETAAEPGSEDTSVGEIDTQPQPFALPPKDIGHTVVES